MRLTRVLKEKVTKELNNKRLCLGKEAKQDYKDRQGKASEEIRKYLKTTVATEIQKILTKYNMDTNNIISDQAYFNEILGYRPHHIANQKEQNKIKRDEDNRYDKMLEMFEDFVIECELGVDKDQFFEALKNLCSKFEDEAK